MWRALLFLAAQSLVAADLAANAVAILERRCVGCHGSARKAAGLDLRSRPAMLAGGGRGAALIPFDPESSLLCQVVSGRLKPAMPPGGTLTESEAETLRDWVEGGAPWPALEPRMVLSERPLTARDREHWAFRKPVRAPAEGWLNPVVEEADRRTLVRRLYLDVLGLPPSPEEVARFLEDRRGDAWARQVDTVLGSPHYGERWAAHWLDVVRYADSAGYEFDWDRPQAWRYRDWVVEAFNRGMPYDRFLREQIAGDELDEPTAASRIATGFLRLGAENNLRNETTRADELDDVVTTAMAAFQGLTIGCARCHDHKYDPLSRRDYYRVQAVFASIRPKDYPLAERAVVEAHEREMRRLDRLADPHRQRRAVLESAYRRTVTEAKIAGLPDYMREAWNTPPAGRTPGQKLTARQIEQTLEVSESEWLAAMTEADREAYRQAGEALAEIERRRPAAYDAAMSIGEYGREALPSDAEPGAVKLLEESVPFRLRTPPEGAQSTWRRRSFAEWLASPENPLTARVMVNRIWQHHFGVGLVPTENNFGRAGERPSLGGLLDALAVEFVDSGWSVKAIERRILNSSLYRSRAYPRRRLEAEAIRDSMLAAAGMLDGTVGGPAVFPYIDPALWQLSSLRQWPGKADTDASTWRRSLYVFRKRSIRYPLFEVFDQPDAGASCARRNASATAVQALAMMNNSAVRLAASRMAERVRREAGSGARAQVARVYELALARVPSAAEQERAVRFIGESGLADFCHVVLNLNEFLYLP